MNDELEQSGVYDPRSLWSADDPVSTESTPDQVVAGAVRRLHPDHISASRIAGLIMTSILFVTAGIGAVILWVLADVEFVVRVAITTAALGIVIVSGVFAYFWPPLEYARTSWRVSSEGLEIKRGVLWRRVVTVPLSRIQHTDVAQGPLQRRFGLSTLVVHTAGTHASEVNLVGISRETALAIRDYLLDSGALDGD